MANVVAVDIDLRSCHYWGDGDERGTGVLPGTVYREICQLEPALVLLECASPHLYAGVVHEKTLSWMIYNSAVVQYLACELPMDVLVSPSSRWTKQYGDKERWKLAGIPERYANKHIRDCRAMVWFYRHDPEAWMPWWDYLGTI